MTETLPATAHAKIMGTLRELSRPDEDAGELELTLASVAIAAESRLAAELSARQATGELDEFVLALTRWLAWHRSDHVSQLLVVQVPRHREISDLPAGTRLHLLDEAAGASAQAPELPL